MARIQPLTKDSASGESKELLEQVEKKMGKIPNILGTMAHSPAVLKTYLSASEALSGGLLSNTLREQIALLVSQNNECNYCLSAHTAIGKSAGLSDDEALESRAGKSNDPKTQAALDFAKAVYDKKGFVDDSDLQAVRDAGYGDGEIIEIVANVVMNFYTNYFNHVVETEVDFPQVPELTSA